MPPGLPTAIILSVLLISVPLSFVWAHHEFIIGLNPFLEVVFELLALMAIISFCLVLLKIFKTQISFTPDVFFAIGFFNSLALIFMLRILYGSSAVEIHLHDTYFIISSSYAFFFISIAFATFAAIYPWFPKIFNRQMNNLMGYLHFWLTLSTAYVLLWPTQDVVLAGRPRSYYDYSDWESLNEFSESNRFISITVIVLFIAQLLFLLNFCYSIYRGKKGRSI